MSGEPIFTVHVETDVDLTVADVWPDGDNPKNPTADDVAEVMEAWLRTRQRGMRRLLDDWNLLDDLEVGISGPGLDEDVTYVKVKPS